MYLIEQISRNLLPQIERRIKKIRTNVGDRKSEIGALLHFIGKSKGKVTGIKCRDK